MSRKAVFLDRDGVLNEAIVRNGKPYPPASVSELVIIPDAGECLAELRNAGFLLIVVSNQPDVARGTQTLQAVEQIHSAMRSKLTLDAIYVCYHDSDENCTCRKPKPGMLLTAAADHDIDLPASYMIGDRWRDVDAGAGAGCRTVLIDRGYLERGPMNPPCKTVSRLRDAVAWILAESA